MASSSRVGSIRSAEAVEFTGDRFEVAAVAFEALPQGGLRVGGGGGEFGFEGCDLFLFVFEFGAEDAAAQVVTGDELRGFADGAGCRWRGVSGATRGSRLGLGEGKEFAPFTACDAHVVGVEDFAMAGVAFPEPRPCRLRREERRGERGASPK